METNMMYTDKSAWAEPAENKTKYGQTHLENITWTWVKWDFYLFPVEIQRWATDTSPKP